MILSKASTYVKSCDGETALQKEPYSFFPYVLKRWSFQKIALENDLSCCIIWKDHISFSRKYDLIL